MRWEYVLFVLGVLVCLMGAFLMAFGEGLLGENHTGIATVIGIVGIGIIATSGVQLSARASQREKEKEREQTNKQT